LLVAVCCLAAAHAKPPPSLDERARQFANAFGVMDELAQDTWHARAQRQPECAAIVAKLQAHNAAMLAYPDRAPLVFAPMYHGLGDRLKGWDVRVGVLGWVVFVFFFRRFLSFPERQVFWRR
jgi:hypothetical protein